MVGDRKQFFQLSKTFWMLARCGNNETLRSGAQEGLTNNLSLRWRLMKTIWFFKIRIVSYTTLWLVRIFAGGKGLERHLRKYSSGSSIWTCCLYVNAAWWSTFRD